MPSATSPVPSAAGRKDRLRRQHTGLVLNGTARGQERAAMAAVREVVATLTDTYDVALVHEPSWTLATVVDHLVEAFPGVEFAPVGPRSAMRPDGGILSVLDTAGRKHPVLITEVKNQGTNDARAAQGLKRQAAGNAIERLGKNVIGFRNATRAEGIFPFVCFGYGCDFAEGSSILDRVVTIADFRPLNRVHLMPAGPAGELRTGSFFFREREWSTREMAAVMTDIAVRSVEVYRGRYHLATNGSADQD